MLKISKPHVKSDVRFFFRLEITDDFVYHHGISNSRIEGLSYHAFHCSRSLQDLCTQSRTMGNAENWLRKYFSLCFFLFHLSLVLYPILFHILDWEDELNCLKMWWVVFWRLNMLNPWPGVEINSVAPVKLSGRGLGLVTSWQVSKVWGLWNSNSLRDLHG
jgi:hypothetical protein